LRQQIHVTRITSETVEDFRGALDIRRGDLPFDVWQVFDRKAYEACSTKRIVPVAKLVSVKDERENREFAAGEKPDPRQRAFDHMTAAGRGVIDRRAPLRVVEKPDGTFHVLDGNATAQVLMLAGWQSAPVELVVE
jgi:hypothetical protein